MLDLRGDDAVQLHGDLQTHVLPTEAGTRAAFAAALDELRDAHEIHAALRLRRAQLQSVDSAEAAALTVEIDGLLAQAGLVIATASTAIDNQSQARIAAIREQALRSLVEARYGLVHLYDRAAEVATK